MKKLVAIQYQRNDIDFHRGSFRGRGDVLDIYPASAEDILRVEFFGNQIERVLRLHSLTGEVLEKLNEAIIFPASHYATTDIKLKSAFQEIKTELAEQLILLKRQKKLLEAQRLEQRANFDLEMIKEVGWCSGIENYSRYFDGRASGEPPFTLLDYFPRDFNIFIDESHMTIPQIRGMYFGDRKRKETLVEYGFRLPSALDNRPLNFPEFEKRASQVAYVSATPGPYELKKSGIPTGVIAKAFGKRKISAFVSQQVIRPTGLLDPKVDVRKSQHQIDDLLAEIKKRTGRNQRVLVTTLTKRMAEELAEYLKEAGIKVHYLHSEIDTFKRLEILRDLRLGVYDVIVGINLLREGIDLPEVSLVAILDADKEGYLRSATALIQVMGRAARHQEGHIIMYADRITTSMRTAINETSRRRKLQQTYNERHHITPQTIEKKIKDERLSGAKLAEDQLPASLPTDKIPLSEIPFIIQQLSNQMELAAKNLEFEKAAKLRDQISELKKIPATKKKLRH